MSDRPFVPDRSKNSLHVTEVFQLFFVRSCFFFHQTVRGRRPNQNLMSNAARGSDPIAALNTFFEKLTIQEPKAPQKLKKQK